MTTREHWDTIYRSQATEHVGWYEPSPSTLDLVVRYSTPADPVIDIGGGDSRIVDELVDADHQDVTVLDLSNVALERARHRLGPAAGNVNWIRADITVWEPDRTWALWHDRAVFHFLTDEHDRRRYVETARRAVAPGGHLIVAAFAADGPDHCAGLPVDRYGAEELAGAFDPAFRLVEHAELPGPTSGVGDRRPYVVAVLRRR
ncbi:MAG: class I SAM-dependent methyltransferase [Acidimicrobiales bacterium]